MLFSVQCLTFDSVVRRKMREANLVGPLRRLFQLRDARQMAVAEAYARFTAERPDGGPMDFFQWIIDNWDEILRLIMTLVSLFSND